MAITRFDYVPEQGIMDTYVPMPFNEMYAAGAGLQKKADEAEAEAIKLGDTTIAKGLSQVRTTDGKPLAVQDYNQADEFVKGINQELLNMTENIANKKGRSSSEYKAELQKLKRKVDEAKGSRGVLGRAEANAAAYADIQKTMQDNPDLIKAPWLAESIDNELRRFASGEDNILEAGIPIGEYVDRAKTLDDLSKGIGSVVTQMYASPDNQGHIRSGKMEEVTTLKIQEMVRGFYLNSQVQSDIQAQIAGEIASGSLDPKDAKLREAELYAPLETALVTKYRSSKGDKSVTSDSNWATKLKMVQDARTTSRPTESIRQDLGENAVKDLGALKFKDGKLQPTETYRALGHLHVNELKAGKADPSAYLTKEQQDKAIAMQEATLKEIGQKYGFSGSVEDIYNAYVNADKKLGQKEINTHNYDSESMRKHMTSKLLDNIKGRAMTLSDGTGVSKTDTYDQVLEDLGLTAAEFEENIKDSKIGGYSAQGPYPGASFMEVLDKDGNRRRLFVAPDTEQANTFSRSYGINQAMLSREETVVPGGYNNKNEPIAFKVIPKLTADGWKYRIQQGIGNSSSDFIPNKDSNISFEQIERMEDAKWRELLGNVILK